MCAWLRFVDVKKVAVDFTPDQWYFCQAQEGFVEVAFKVLPFPGFSDIPCIQTEAFRGIAGCHFTPES